MAKRKEDPAIRPYNAKEWRALSEKEQNRLLTNLVNRLNRRAVRLEKAGLKDFRGYQAIEELSERAGGEYQGSKTARLTKGFTGMSESEKRKYYKRLVSASSQRTGTVQGAKAEILRLGTTASGRVIFSPAEYAELTDKEKGNFWKSFHKLRDRLGNKYDPGTKGGGNNTTLQAFQEMYKNNKAKGTSRLNITSNRAKAVLERMQELAEENAKAHPTWSGSGGFTLSSEYLDE